MFLSVSVHVSGFVIYKDMVATYPVTQVVAIQLAIGAALLWLIAIISRQPLRLHGPLWRIAVLSCCSPVGIFLLMAFATTRTSATEATIIFGLVPVILPLLGWIVLRERLRVSVMLGALTAFTGIVLIISRRIELGSGDLFGDFLVLLAVITTSAGQLAGRRVNQYFSNAIMVSTYQVTFAAVIVSTIMIFVHPPTPLLSGATGGTFAKLLYLGAASVVINYLTYNYALRRLPVGRTGLYVALAPVIGTILAVLFLGEIIGLREVIGIGIVISGVMMPAVLPPGFWRTVLGRFRTRRKKAP